MGRSIELSKPPGEELVRDMELARTFCDGDIFVDASEPDLPMQKPKRYKLKNLTLKIIYLKHLQIKLMHYFYYPSLKMGRPSNISTIFPAEREALLRFASRKRREGSRGNGFL